MKAFQVLLSLAALQATVWGSAPESIGGRVYRDTTAITGLCSIGERTIVFRSDGRFVFLKVAGLEILSESTKTGGRVLLRNPSSDGSYVYTKTGDSLATIKLVYDEGIPLILNLTFTSAAGDSGIGTLPVGGEGPSTFQLDEIAPAPLIPISNVAVRGRPSPGHPLIAGFVIPGIARPNGINVATLASANQRDVLIRAVGPSLQQFGFTDAMADPDFLVVSPKALGFTEFHYSDWSSIVYYGLPGEPPTTRHSDPNPDGVAAFRKIFSYVGAFPLLDGSKDAADVLRLAPGSYTVVVDTPTADSTGEVLIEVYLLP